MNFVEQPTQEQTAIAAALIATLREKQPFDFNTDCTWLDHFRIARFSEVCAAAEELGGDGAAPIEGEGGVDLDPDDVIPGDALCVVCRRWLAASEHLHDYPAGIGEALVSSRLDAAKRCVAAEDGNNADYSEYAIRQSRATVGKDGNSEIAVWAVGCVAAPAGNLPMRIALAAFPYEPPRRRAAADA